MQFSEFSPLQEFYSLFQQFWKASSFDKYLGGFCHETEWCLALAAPINKIMHTQTQ